MTDNPSDLGNYVTADTCGAVGQSYVHAMHEREASVSTYMGNGLAIPHGTNEAKDSIRRTGISFVRYAEPIDRCSAAPAAEDPHVDSDTRQGRIVEFARTRGLVEVAALAEELDVAAETIRRDLTVLAGRRMHKRVHGGAVPGSTPLDTAAIRAHAGGKAGALQDSALRAHC
ncbi:hypothetical protein MSAR_19320 [Mycolicibacterium sarraceniae]|uniref:Mannitol-specific phosphotransferase enzyme IIA component n=1 Tax=Mycolicibacterium sarraceniae TaxID=1534348 RepID=A0A7I7SSJ8_9MYCO|nr:hypothetical protein MSAR_19320 [Mycolicibacterium sarraceniae]